MSRTGNSLAHCRPSELCNQMHEPFGGWPQGDCHFTSYIHHRDLRPGTSGSNKAQERLGKLSKAQAQMSLSTGSWSAREIDPLPQTPHPLLTIKEGEQAPSINIAWDISTSQCWNHREFLFHFMSQLLVDPLGLCFVHLSLGFVAHTGVPVASPYAS